MACPKGQYYCNTHQECKPIPAGHKVLKNGELVKEDLNKFISNELEGLKKSKKFTDFKGDIKSLGGQVKDLVQKHDTPETRSKIKTIGLNFASQAINQLSKTAQQKVDSFREEFIDEGDAKTIKGIKCTGSGNTKDLSKGPNEKCGVDYRYLVRKTDKKKEVVSASYNPEGDTIEEIDGSKVALGLTAGVFGAGLELVRRGKKFADKLKEKMDQRTKLKEEVQGGINIETYTDGIQFNEIETVNIIEPPKMKSSAHFTFIENIKEETK